MRSDEPRTSRLHAFNGVLIRSMHSLVGVVSDSEVAIVVEGRRSRCREVKVKVAKNEYVAKEGHLPSYFGEHMDQKQREANSPVITKPTTHVDDGSMIALLSEGPVDNNDAMVAEMYV